MEQKIIQKTIHFFGEMDLDMNKTPKQVYKKAWNIAEQCGYSVSAVEKTKSSSAHIVMLGEDSPDGYQIESILNMDEYGTKFRTIQKVLYKLNESEHYWAIKDGRKMIKVWNYLSGEWVMIFDLEHHEIELKGDVRYQQALAKEGKKDHILYTGNGVEKRKCTCIDGDKCQYFACVNCKSQEIEFGNYTHCCKKCNRLQDVKVLESFIVCNKHGKFSRDQGECSKCMMEF